MSDRFFPVPLRQLLEITWEELHSKDSFFGIPRELFHTPPKRNSNPLGTVVFGNYLANPLGVAAGPHSQLAQNIIAAWLMGARYIELKTVQTLDELDVSKPCIDMQDEGYNCEWSQELKIRQSFDEYLNAWIAIHLLSQKLGWEGDLGCIFNMSVGYDLKGIQEKNVQWFFKKMSDCSEELQAKREEIWPVFPEIDSLEIPTRISDNITLSTMHGCPANEIEAIARYLMEEKKLHTYVKLNPTLLGPERLREILNTCLNFRTRVPDQAFEHDLAYSDAVKMIHSLLGVADRNGREFGLKLTNTLESENFKAVFGKEVDQMYMSGRALHPLAINLASSLQQEFAGRLSLSFSGGTDAFNVGEVLECGFKSITVCTDLLKPGGYMRLNQYFEQIQEKVKQALPVDSDRALKNLGHYAGRVLMDETYKRTALLDPDIKTTRELGPFDCISAPCRDTCATHQDIPQYMFFTSLQKYNKGLEVVLRTNPFPAVTGMVCDHLCQNKCTRVHYDQALQIREVKRFLAERGEVPLKPEYPNGLEVAVIGAGPAGLSCAFFLALAGFSVDVYEARPKAGGMVQYAIPGFRLTNEAFEQDLRRILSLGVRVHYGTRIDENRFRAIREKVHYLFVGAGAQLPSLLKLEGMDADGVIDPLSFLMRVKNGEPAGIGKQVLIIGGGNTAMDAARTAFRLVGEDGRVTIVYRRTIQEMPADQGEIKAVLEEGVEVLELTGPESVLAEQGRVKALRCYKMVLSDADESGRPRPVQLPGSEFELACDTIIPAVGQELDIDFVDQALLKADPGSFMTRIDNVFIGGDAMRGASTAINAIGDGRKAAGEIMKQAFFDFQIDMPYSGKPYSLSALMVKRARREFGPKIPELSLDDRRNFKLVQQPLEEKAVVREAARCLYCDELCNSCTTVCPNFANYAYQVDPEQVNLQKAVRIGRSDEVRIVFDKVFEICQSTQILNIANFCNECGNCTTFCPTASAPYKEKPRLHLSIPSFYGSEEGYYLSLIEGRKNLIYKQNGSHTILSETETEYIFETAEAITRLDKDNFSIKEVVFSSPEGKEVNLRQAACMKVIMKGAENFFPPLNYNPGF